MKATKKQIDKQRKRVRRMHNKRKQLSKTITALGKTNLVNDKDKKALRKAVDARDALDHKIATEGSLLANMLGTPDGQQLKVRHFSGPEPTAVPKEADAFDAAQVLVSTLAPFTQEQRLMILRWTAEVLRDPGIAVYE